MQAGIIAALCVIGASATIAQGQLVLTSSKGTVTEITDLSGFARLPDGLKGPNETPMQSVLPDVILLPLDGRVTTLTYAPQSNPDAEIADLKLIDGISPNDGPGDRLRSPIPLPAPGSALLLGLAGASARRRRPRRRRR